MPTAALRPAVIYTRVSSKKQLKGNGPADQLSVCRAYANQHGFEIIHEFIDGGVSGATLKRPEFDKLKALAGKVDAVIIPVHSRFSRADDVLATLNLMQSIENAGTEIHVTNRGRVTTLNMHGLIMAVIDLYRSTEERKELIEKIRASLHTNAKNGITSMARKRYGYEYIRKEPGRGKQKLVIVPEEAEIVKDIFNWFAIKGPGPDGAKLTTYGIADELTRRGVPTACDNLVQDEDAKPAKRKGYGVWTQSTVRQILRNPMFKGQQIYGRTRNIYYENEDGDRVKKVVKQPITDWKFVPVEPIVSAELWDAAQQQFEINKINNLRRATKGRYLLRGLITCSQCNFKFFGEQSKPGIFAYRCAGTRKVYSSDGKTLSCHGYFRMELLDCLVWEAIKGFLLDPSSLLAGHGAMNKERRTKETALKKRQRDIAKQIIDKQQQEERMIDAYKDGIINKAQLLDRLESIKSDIAEKHSENDNIARELENITASEETQKSVIEFCRETARNIDYLTDSDKRIVLEELNVKILLDRDQNVLILTGTRIPTTRIDLSNSRYKDFNSKPAN